MAVKSVGWKQAHQALSASGLGVGSLIGLVWPIGREKRTRALLRERKTVLEAKNQIMDYLFRAQRPLVALGIRKQDQLNLALRDPERKRLIMSFGANRSMVEEVLASRYGSEGGRALDQALGELVRAGLLMRAPATVGSDKDIFVAVHTNTRPRWDLSALNRLLQEGRDFGSELKARFLKQEEANQGRTHRL